MLFARRVVEYQRRAATARSHQGRGGRFGRDRPRSFIT